MLRGVERLVPPQLHEPAQQHEIDLVGVEAGRGPHVGHELLGAGVHLRERSGEEDREVEQRRTPGGHAPVEQGDRPGFEGEVDQPPVAVQQRRRTAVQLGRQGCRIRVQPGHGVGLRAGDELGEPPPPTEHQPGQGVGPADQGPHAVRPQRGGPHPDRTEPHGRAAGEGPVDGRDGVQDPPGLGPVERARPPRDGGGDVPHEQDDVVAIPPATEQSVPDPGRQRVEPAGFVERQLPVGASARLGHEIGRGPGPLEHEPGPVVEAELLDDAAGAPVVALQHGPLHDAGEHLLRTGDHRRGRSLVVVERAASSPMPVPWTTCSTMRPPANTSRCRSRR
jgi:hypothetical protein